MACDDKASTMSASTPGPTASTAPEPTAEAPEEPSDTAEEPEAPAASAANAADEDPKPAADSPGAAKPSSTKAAVSAGGSDDAKEVNKGKDVGAASFSAWLQSSGTYEAGKQGSVTAVLVAKPPYKCNAKYPYKFKPSSTTGITYPQSTVRGMQVSPKRSTMIIPFVPSEKGKATVSGELAFSICTDERCVIEKRQLSVTVDVQ